ILTLSLSVYFTDDCIVSSTSFGDIHSPKSRMRFEVTERIARGPFAVRKAWLSREIYGLLNDNGPRFREPSWIFSFGAGNAASRDRRNRDQFWQIGRANV